MKSKSAKAIVVLLCAAFVAGCSVLPEPPAPAEVYDFGLGEQLVDININVQAPLPPIALADISTTAFAEGSTALLYRLSYANAQQLRPYAHARWSLPPAQLLTQALSQQLGQQRIVLQGKQGLTQRVQQKQESRWPAMLRVELEEFSHIFTAPAQSSALVRLRASLSMPSNAGQVVIAQRSFSVQQSAHSHDAAGGARALADSARQAAEQVAQWLEHLGQ